MRCVEIPGFEVKRTIGRGGMATVFLAEDLKQLPLPERKQCVLDAINGTGPHWSEEVPTLGNEALAQRVTDTQSRLGLSEAHAVILEVLRRAENQHPAMTVLVNALDQGTLPAGDGAEGGRPRRGVGGGPRRRAARGVLPPASRTARAAGSFCNLQRGNFTGLILGYIEADFASQYLVRIRKLSLRSTQ